MSYSSSVLFRLLLFLQPLVTQVALGQILTLERAVAIALCDNPSLAVLEHRINEANADVCRARAEFYPSARASMDALHGDTPSQYLFQSIDAGRLKPNTDFNDPGSFTSLGLRLSLEQELFTWGRRTGTLAAASAGCCAAQYYWLDYANQLVGMVISAYLDTLKARAAYETAERSIQLLAQQLELARAKLAREVVLKTDVLKLEVRLSEMQERSIVAHSAERQALEILASLIGIEDASGLMTADSPIGESLLPDSVVVDPDATCPNAYAAWAAEAEVTAADRRYSVAQSYGKPAVDFFAQTDVRTFDQVLDIERTNWVIGCKVTWDLFSGGRNGARRRMACASLNQAEERLRKAQRHTDETIALSKLRREEAKERLRVALAGEHSAKESLKLTQVQYEKGVASITSFLEAEQMLAAASLRARTAGYDLFKAEAEVLGALGLLYGEGLCVREE